MEVGNPRINFTAGSLDLRASRARPHSDRCRLGAPDERSQIFRERRRRPRAAGIHRDGRATHLPSSPRREDPLRRRDLLGEVRLALYRPPRSLSRLLRGRGAARGERIKSSTAHECRAKRARPGGKFGTRLRDSSGRSESPRARARPTRRGMGIFNFRNSRTRNYRSSYDPSCYFLASS